ncbi:MAG: type II secretion system F family protein [Vulcanimicrobiota bacterium]
MAHRHSSAELVTLMRQLAVMVNSGINLLEALISLVPQVENPKLKESLDDIVKRLNSGERLSLAAEAHPTVFGSLVVAMIRLGEESGALVRTLDLLSDWLERDQRTLFRIRSALFYPGIVLSLSAVLMLLLFFFVLPAFVEVFSGFHIRLPIITQVILWMSQQLHQPLFWLLGLGLGLEIYRRLPTLWRRNRVAWMGWLRHLPGVGGAYRSASLARLCSALSCTLPVGVPILRAWSLAAQSSGCPLIHQDAVRVVGCCREGETLTEALEVEPLYPRSLVEMIRAGEESGQLDGLLKRLANLYELDLEHRLTLLAALLEPLLLAVISLVVITLILALMLPLYTLIEQVIG